MRLKLLLSMMFAFVLSTVPDPVRADTAAPRPNIVQIMADDLGWDPVGYNGHPRRSIVSQVALRRRQHVV